MNRHQTSAARQAFDSLAVRSRGFCDVRPAHVARIAQVFCPIFSGQPFFLHTDSLSLYHSQSVVITLTKSSSPARTRLVPSSYSAIARNELRIVESGISFQHQRCCTFQHIQIKTDPRAEPPFQHCYLRPRLQRWRTGRCEPCMGSSAPGDLNLSSWYRSFGCDTVDGTFGNRAVPGINDGQHSAGHFL